MKELADGKRKKSFSQNGKRVRSARKRLKEKEEKENEKEASIITFSIVVDMALLSELRLDTLCLIYRRIN